MSSSKNLEQKNTSFLTKSNSAFIENMYIRYIEKDPNLPLSWKDYFDTLNDDIKSVVKEPEYMDALTTVLGLSKEFIAKNKGAWLVDARKKPNFEMLSQEEAQQLDLQINKMIEKKYQFNMEKRF